MAAAKLTPEQLRQVREIAARWGKIIARRTFDDAGPGFAVSFATLEQVASAAASGLAEGTLDALLEQQRQALPAEQPCPDCQRPCPVDYESRPMQSCNASITYREPVCHCPACRRDFFPSPPGVGAGRS
jgi:hypothetical protein